MTTKNIQQPNRTFSKETLTKIAIAFAIFIAGAIAFGYIADEVLEGDTQTVDTGLLQVIHVISSPLLTSIVKVGTYFGGVLVVSLLSLFLLIFLSQSRKWKAVIFAGASMGGTLIMFTLLKLLFERQRPFLYNIVTESTYSFPSGHASITCALALVIVFLTWHTRYRKPAVIFGILYVLFIGFTRLYLTVHYPTDVLAGWILATTWVLTVATLCGLINWSPLLRYIKNR